jgi:hypothetical protein
MISKFVDHRHLHYIKKELTVTPINKFQQQQKKKSENTSFSVYLEDKENGRIKIPRFWSPGNGNVISDIEETDSYNPISISFNSELFQNQKKISDDVHNILLDKKGIILSLPCGFGKCLAKDTLVLMHDGKIKKVQDIRIGDKLMGDDSKYRNVLSLAWGKEKMYKITPGDGGRPYIVNKSHILSLKVFSYNDRNFINTLGIVDLSIEDYLKTSNLFKYMGWRTGVSFQRKKTPFDPYILGMWLGQNLSDSSNKIFFFDTKIINHLLGEKLRNTLMYHDKENIYLIELDKLIMKNDLKIIKNKHIPDLYKYNCEEIRLGLLAGIIDSIGYIMFDHFNLLMNKNDRLVSDIIYVSRSLGLGVKNSDVDKDYCKIVIYGRGIEKIPTLLYRNSVKDKTILQDPLLHSISIEELGEDKYYGFEIDGNHRFLLGDFTVTHNTVISINLISRLQLKTLVIVNKTFLLDQWKERIMQFTNARVGKIQQKIVDVHDKDIVIGMLQSLSLKEYDPVIFDHFDIVIVDEVHNIATKSFSKVLMKLKCKYSLGLSATPDRKDGMHHVYQWFLGSSVYKLENAIKPMIELKKVYFTCHDDTEKHLFKEKKLWTGNLNVSCMVTNLSLSKSRNEFIVSMIPKDKDRHVLVLSGRIQQLETLKKIFDSKNTGILSDLYIGNMKKENLEEASKCQVIFATYTMVSEGFDLPRLNCVVFATPMVDIEQSVGRILRASHHSTNKEARLLPMIIDICDTNHGLYYSQAKKRFMIYQRKYSVVSV